MICVIKKIPVYTIPWKILKNFASISQSPTICSMKCSEQWALHPHENTQFVQNPSFQQWAQIGQDFSSGPFLPADSPIASAPRLSLAVLVYFISLPWLLLYFLPSSWLHSPIVLVFAASQVPLNGNALCWNKGANFLPSNRGLLRRMSMISRSAFLKEKLFFDKTKTKTIKNKQTNKQKKTKVSEFSVKSSV